MNSKDSQAAGIYLPQAYKGVQRLFLTHKGRSVSRERLSDKFSRGSEIAALFLRPRGY
jgi:hypothetical protein